MSECWDPHSGPSLTSGPSASVAGSGWTQENTSQTVVSCLGTELIPHPSAFFLDPHAAQSLQSLSGSCLAGCHTILPTLLSPWPGSHWPGTNPPSFFFPSHCLASEHLTLLLLRMNSWPCSSKWPYLPK